MAKDCYAFARALLRTRAVVATLFVSTELAPLKLRLFLVHANDTDEISWDGLSMF